SIPGTPGNVTENSPDIDFIADASGALTVYWNGVTNTGSGITYRVERELDNSGTWTEVGTTAATSLPDSDGPYADDTFIRYRVTAINGVGSEGTPGLSDGVRVDLGLPDVPANVGEGDVIGTDDDFDENNVFYIFWDAVPATATGDTVTYIVERSRNGGAWEQATTTTAASWEDPVPYSNGDTVNYRVIAVNGAGTQSAESAPSDGLTLDFARPDSAVTTGGFYNAFSWPSFIYGTASDALSGVDFVDITLRDAGTGLYWDGDSWETAATWLRATGDTNWQYLFTPTDGHTYDVQSRATDRAGNVEITFGYSSFTYASSGPQAPVVSSPTHPDQGTWYNDDDPTFNWTEPTSGAGIQGYSYILDQIPGTTPDTILDTSANSQSYTDIADGTWYFHVRAQDNADNWGPAGHYVVHIDTTPPPAPSEVTEDTPDVDWDADGNIVVYWDTVTDLSGVTYTLERNINGVEWVEVDSGIVGTSYADFSTNTDGDTVQYRVRATNGVGMSSGWTESDGMTIDSIPPGSPAPVTEGIPDIDWSADGTVTVHWSAVADTGSGITYRLERSVNGVWTTIAPALANTSYADSGTYNDGDEIQYRVTAVSGVGLEGPTATSDGMTIDSGTPDTPASVTEETPDVDWDFDGNVTVYWSAVADTGSGITYRLERNVNYTGWTVVTTQTGTSFADSGTYNDNDFIQYRVTAISGVGLEGAPRTSDGVTVDNSVPGTPENVTENDPDIDYHPNADGAVTVYWDAVTDTGSGIRYLLERQVNDGPWAEVAGSIASTFYPDSGAYADDDLIRYRVTAINGVGTAGNAGLSDGFRIDLTDPDIPANVGEGDVAGTDDDFDQDNTYWVFWDAVASTATGDQITYEVQRSRNGGAWELAGTGLLCSTTPCQWEDPVPFSNGDTVQYRVIAGNSAGRSSDPSATSDGITLDFAQPDSAVTTSGYYNSFNWPGFIYGTASDSLSDVDFVDISIQRQSDGQYWNGTSWQAGEAWMRTTGTLNWQYAFAPDDGETYTVRSRATDNAGNVEITFGVGSFTYAASGPPAPEISSPTHPVEGTWYNDNDPTFNWTTPDSPAGIQGYSYVLDHSPTTLPDSIIETNENTVSYTDLDDGVWYFHVRAQDNADNWGTADHFQVNIDTATPAAPDEVTEETPDVDWDADGDITVYWSAVDDTGSGITYRLERNLNGGGWELVAAGLTATDYADTGYANGDEVFYRVRAANGVGLMSGWTESDGVTFDLTTPQVPVNVGEGDTVGTDDDWDQDNTFYVFWDAVPDTPSGITYSVERSRNGGAWDEVVTGLVVTQWEDPMSYSSGESVAYRVTAHTGAGISSAPSDASDGLTLDFVRPDSTVETGGYYNNFTWPGHIQGTASDNLSDVAFVDITIRRQSDEQYWNGTAWVAGRVWLRATGTANWQYTFAPDDGETYDVESRATDNAGNVEISLGSSTFNYSSSGPAAPEISSPTHPDEDTWYNDNDPTFSWTTPPSGAGISGYSYILDQAPDTEPDLFADTSGNTRSYTNVADGIWYFHVRALDNAGKWGPPDHFRVNIDTTNPAAPDEVTEEDPDVDWDADGDITVYWSEVTDTSDVSYTLERSINGGGTWEAVATGITATSYLDPVTHGDNVTILYRVRAVDAVNLPGPWTQSDGVTIDSETPAQPTGLGEGDVVGIDDAWDQDNTFYVFWDAVANTGSGIVYSIERSVNGSAWEVVQTDYEQIFWEDPQVFADGDTVQYRVTAVNGVGIVGPASAASSGITLDFTQPDSDIDTAGTYGPVSWPGHIAGTASDDTSGVSSVHITLQRASDSYYWNGGAWVASPVWLIATGTAAWTYDFVPEDGESYNVQSRATDAAGNVEISYGVSTFNYTTSEPDSTVNTSGLYVGAEWPGQIEGTAYAPLAALDFVDITIQRASDDLYFDGTAWVGTPIWLRATGTNPWIFAFTPDDGETYTVESRATDVVGNVETAYGTGTFSYDATAPEVETVTVTSDGTYFYDPGLDADGGTVYFNSEPGEGADQVLTVTITFDEPHPASMAAAPAFDDTPPLDTTAPWTAEYSVEAYAGTQSNVLFTVADTLGLTDTTTINFVQDNLPPDSEASIAEDATNTAPIVIDWEASDNASGVYETHLWVKYQPIGNWSDTGLSMTGVSGSFDYTPTSGTGTYYFATVAVDNVGNVQSEPTGFGDDQIDFDNVPPTSSMDAPTYAVTSPIIITWTASDDAKYTYLYYRYGETGDWHDVTFSSARSGTFEFEPTDGDGHYYFATVAMDEAGNAEAIASDGKALTIYDTTPPTSEATSPAEWDEFAFIVEWTGDDTAVGSGIAFFDVQVKIGDDGEWTDWLTHTTETSATYTAVYVDEPDALYHFRSRATDNAGHIEDWPEDPNGDTTTLVHFPGSFPGKYKIFLPLVMRSYGPTTYLPDLVVDSIEVVPANPDAGQAVDVRVTIRNAGNVNASRGFWVDLYIDPPDPSQIEVNRGWSQVGCSQGLVWTVYWLNAGDSVVLSTINANNPDNVYYWPEYSNFGGYFTDPGAHTLYAQVDSWNTETTYGAIYEANEGNNIHGPATVSVGGRAASLPLGSETPAAIPPRPNEPPQP
ncbi:MAG: Ig-like domain repeat protein, partial [Anaerolineae bacterium]|nr:Ig-like domain repeat protein [Anaerolineae bacterium]